MASTDEGVNGHPAALTTARAVEEMRRGRAIQLFDGSDRILTAAVETMEAPLLERLRRIGDTDLKLFVTPERAQATGLMTRAAGPVAISIPPGTGLEALRCLAGLEPQVPVQQSLMASTQVESGACVATGFRLAKLGRLMPALVVVPTDELEDPGLLTFDVEGLTHFAPSAQESVELISRAKVPLIDAVDCEIVLFRQRGELGQHLAIVIGQPSAQTDVPVRLHSACLTGDVLGSLRCDCGDQLKRAIGRIASLGGGVLLYLDQEGRGIGLANKLRAYALQDTGLDTMDADQHLGFLPDERDYAVAAAALRELGITRIRLLTNNPAKISALKQHGIEVTGRLPLIATVNAYNQRYLKAKLDRAGHLAE
jgi:GTP cyclohydrolase II